MLEAVDLECARGGRALFRGLSFSLRAGEVLRVAGANGRGKTSLLRILCGLLTPHAGEVRWRGSAIRALAEEFFRSLLYIGHAPALKDDLTAEENLSIACTLAGDAVHGSGIASALERLQVPRGVFVKKLSQGQRRRALLARLAVSEARPLWLLDEPFAALDTDAAGVVETLVAAHVARGGMAIYTSHQESRMAGREIRLDA
ncbi:MAG TPA: cytochrome c biogenesis heme-transporting ATPase CcmA [Burkholderiales bacterium]|nr:cytochrome c biogenesis heme-transporting ATPase CcmA [Burkholderiales bacterium]